MSRSALDLSIIKKIYQNSFVTDKVMVTWKNSLHNKKLDLNKSPRDSINTVVWILDDFWSAQYNSTTFYRNQNSTVSQKRSVYISKKTLSKDTKDIIKKSEFIFFYTVVQHNFYRIQRKYERSVICFVYLIT